jgi:hypothetical protein
MSSAKAIEFSQIRYFVVGALLLALLAAAPLSVAAGSLSGDDAYDPAAGSFPQLFVAAAPSSFSGDDPYDPAAGAYPALFVGFAAVDFSGDDAYDPAAGGLSELAGNAIEVASCPVPSLAEVGRYSGDDAYDPAVVGIFFELPVC